jgi:hypothetical protein
VRLLQAIGSFDTREFAGGRNPAVARAHERWKQIHAELMHDADSLELEEQGNEKGSLQQTPAVA